MKRKLFAGALILICLAVLVNSTLAYFTQVATAHNVITSGEINIDLLEWADAEKTTPFPEDGVHNVMPGASITKIVEVRNSGANAAYIRAKVDIEVSGKDGSAMAAGKQLLNISFNTADWTEQGGYYYYNEALEPGEVTEPLLSSVKFARSMGNEYQNSTVRIDVDVYAVQVDNNGASALTAAGWPM